MRFLVFQHAAIEHLGFFRGLFAKDDIRCDVIQLNMGNQVPSLENYDALWVMGGAMNVWDEYNHSWLITEKRAIQEAVLERALPFVGVCLGHQLLTTALGGTVDRAATPKIGIGDLVLTDDGRADPLFHGFMRNFKALEWHSAEVSKVPSNAVILAESSSCRVEAIRVGRHAYGFQFHPETTEMTVPEWGADRAVSRALDDALGPRALSRLEAEVLVHLPAFHRDAGRLYKNFMELVCSR